MTTKLSRRTFNRLGLSLGLLLGGGAGAGPARATENAMPVAIRPPFLRGTNFGGMNFTPGQIWPARPAVDYYIHSKKMNVIRLCLLWELVQPELHGPIAEDQIAGITDQIDRITGAGAHVILELHNYGRRTVARFRGTLTRDSNTVTDVAPVADIRPGQTFHTEADWGFTAEVIAVAGNTVMLSAAYTGASASAANCHNEVIIGETDQVTAEHFADVWHRIAQQWGGNSKVIFELINEPHDQRTDVLVSVSNLAIQAIRATGAGQLIMVSPNNWNSYGWPSGDNATHMLNIVDPIDNVCFDMHHYFDEWSAGQTPYVRENPVEAMRVFLAWARENGRKAFCGEFACGMNSLGIAACRELLSLIEANADVFLGWSWWGSGGCWPPDYIYLLDPFAVPHAAANPDPQGSVTWDDPVDRPQMKLLQAFLPHDAAPFNAWLIEDQLPAGRRASYRRGDLQEHAGLLDGSFTWADSGPDSHDAALTLEISTKLFTPGADGGVSLDRQGRFLTAGMPCGDGGSIYAMIALAGTTAAAPRTIVALPENPRLVVSPDGHVGLAQNDGAVAGQAAPPPIPPGVRTLVRAAIVPTDGGDGTQALLSVGAGNSARQTIGATGCNGTDIVIGARDDAGDEALGGVLYDLLLFDTVPSAEDDACIQGRLCWDNGIAAQLPAGHPYRLRPPAST